MNYSLPPELERFVQAKVDSGLYSSANELLCDALHLFIERDALAQRRREELDALIQEAMDQAARGEVISAEESKKRLAIFKTEFFNDNQ